MTPLRVLLVEDSRIFQAAAATHLCEFRSVGRLEIAQSADEACARLNTEVFDLVLMDISTPGMDGITATARIKARPDAPRIVVVTAHTAPEYRTAAQAAGADGFILKEDFFGSIGDLLGRMQQSVAAGSKPDEIPGNHDLRRTRRRNHD